MSLLKRIESARPGQEPGGAGVPAPVAPSGGGTAPPTAPSAPRPMSQAPVRESFRDVKFRIQNRVIQDLDPKLDLSNQVEVRRQIEEIFGKVIDEEGLALTRAERVRMLEQITDEIIGLGPLEPLLRDESISEIMVIDANTIYVEKNGKIILTDACFTDDERVRACDGRAEARRDLVAALAVDAVVAEREPRVAAGGPPLPLAALVGGLDPGEHIGVGIPGRRPGRDRPGRAPPAGRSP